ncbi:circadian clock KaiB family protein [Streptomyces sp. Ru73]|uniref:circadian clock KaiB family protein n=1 Tax=Streptomyces sp. Ru73 TaxID=2080748 RepID=UPI001CA5E4E3|nr:circadian clock KaiB family protein [Streptomyces sp. Ru73]
MTTYSFRLFIAGQTVRSQEAVANLRLLCDSRLRNRYDLQIVDAVECPELAEEGRVLATPMVIRLSPPPQRRVVGDLSDHHRAAVALGLPGANEHPQEVRP